MDFKKEIWGRSLPNFGYVIDMDNGGCCVVVLGGQGTRKSESIEFRESICYRNTQMQDIYHQDTLSDSDKKQLAVLLQKIYTLCDARKEGLFTWDEQEAFINGLSAKERAQLIDQIQMLKDCRSFCRDYL